MRLTDEQRLQVEYNKGYHDGYRDAELESSDAYDALKWLIEDINNKEAIISRVSTRTKIMQAITKREIKDNATIQR